MVDLWSTRDRSHSLGARFQTLSNVVVDLAYFMCIALLVLTGYSYAGVTMYGHESGEFKSFTSAMHT